MKGMHDLGGKDGFGPVHLRRRKPAYTQQWEADAHALSSLARLLGYYNMDEYRHAIERMEPRHYVGASYYERVLTSCATLCAEKGFVTLDELNPPGAGAFRLAMPARPGRMNAVDRRARKIGDIVRTRDEVVTGHHRLPGYAMGKQGEIVGISPAFHFPDAAGHGLASEDEVTYDVRFDAVELWGTGAEQATVTLSVFESYLV